MYSNNLLHKLNGWPLTALGYPALARSPLGRGDPLPLPLGEGWGEGERAFDNKRVSQL